MQKGNNMSKKPLVPKPISPRDAEQIYDRINSLWDFLNQHKFSRSLPARDASVILKVETSLRGIANQVFNAGHEEQPD
jgi:hypothetical protein